MGKLRKKTALWRGGVIELALRDVVGRQIAAPAAEICLAWLAGQIERAPEDALELVRIAGGVVAESA